MPSRKQEFDRKVRELIAQAKNLRGPARRQVLEMLDAARKRIAGQLAGLDQSTFSAAQLQQLKRSIDEAFEFFRRDATAAIQQRQDAAFRLGSVTVDSALDAAGFPAPALGGVSRNTLSIAQGYTADLVSGLSKKAAADVNGAIQRAFLGGQSVTEIIQQVARGLGAPGEVSLWSKLGERATTIALNEILRVHSISQQARLEDLRERHPDMQKEWRWVNAGQMPRAPHRDYSGTVVGVDEAFEVAPRYGLPPERLMYPRDPNGSPENTINCHCLMAPYFAAEDLKPTARHEQILRDLGIRIEVRRAA
ncbi:MAG TPA: phage minor head protein [Candidatus Nitrosotenuis sp.]|nr:phage minor head protein [Candidatus Nitrosotenuis sp.]